MQINIKDEQNNIVYTYGESLWTGKRTLFVNGVEAKKITKKKFELQTEEGTKTYEVKGSLQSDITIICDGYAVSSDHTKYEKFLIWLPYVSIIIGLIVGGVIGILVFSVFAFIAQTINIDIMNSKKSPAIKVILGLLVFVLTTGIAVVVDLVVVAGILLVAFG